MKISIKEATQLTKKFLANLGFSKEVATSITQNLIEAELSNKPSQGLVRLNWLKKIITDGTLDVKASTYRVEKETPVSLLIDGENTSGYHIMRESLKLAQKKVIQSGLVAVGLTNTGPTTGFMGEYARIIAEKDLIFIAYTNSRGRVVPFGSKQRLWGTNPHTFGIPSKELPVIHDMATSKISVGDIFSAKALGKKLKQGVAIDETGEITTDPNSAYDGGILTISEHKGSGLALIVELLAGALTNSKVGMEIAGGWGTFYIVINPEIMRNVEEFKKDVYIATQELKNSAKMPGTDEIFFPGERSQKHRQQCLETGQFEISSDLLKSLQ